MIRNEEHAFPALGDIVPSPHASKIEREAEEQKGDETGANHGNVGCPDPQTPEYWCNQHGVHSFGQIRPRAATPDIVFRYHLILDGFKQFLAFGEQAQKAGNLR